MIKVRVTWTWKDGSRVAQSVEFMSDKFDDLITRLWQRLQFGRIKEIRIETVS